METTGHGFEQSSSIVNMAPALVKALEEIGNATADSTNPAFRSKYADLASVKDAARPVYKHGIAVLQHVLSGPDGTPGLRNTLLHASGEWMASWAYCKPDKSGPQAVGAVITYLRRYMLAAALNIAQEDDDANGAEKPRGNGHGNQPPPAPSPPAEPPKWFETVPGKAKMKLLHTVLGKLALGETEADRKGLKGKSREEFTHAAKLGYLRWCIGRAVASSKELTEVEADKVVAKAQTGEMPNE